jgi:2-dehydro-3-deoxyphosphooctonate aldolase (KDO 8-P synthase)
MNSFEIGNIEVGLHGEFFIIAGPCVIESEAVCLEVAEFLVSLQETTGVKCVYQHRQFPGAGLGKGSGDS